MVMDEFELPYPQYRCPQCGRDLPLNEARLTVTCASHQPEDDLAFVVREARAADRADIEEICDRALGETELDLFDRTFDVMKSINFIAEVHDELGGLLSLSIVRGEAIIVLLSVYPDYQGKSVGASLLRAAMSYSREHGLPVMRVAVSNDDISLLYFYQRHGFVISDIAVGKLVDDSGSAVAGFSGIPSRDEIRLHCPVCQHR